MGNPKLFQRGRIGRIPILNYFPINLKRKKSVNPFIVPQDTLPAILNLNIESQETVFRFCYNYQIFPRDLTEGFYKGFIKEYNQLVPLIRGAMSSSLTTKEKHTIATELLAISPTIKTVTKEELIEMNNVISGKIPQNSLEETPQKEFYIEARNQNNPMARLYEDLKDLIIGKQTIIRCKGCHRYIMKKANRLYCENDCKDRYNQKKSYRKKTKTSQS